MTRTTKTLTPREQAVERLQAELGRTWRVIDAPKTVDAISAKTLVVIQTEIERVALQSWQPTLELTVVVNTDNEGKLERALYEVLEALDTARIGWTRATRATFLNQYPCYLLTLTGRTTIKKEA